MGFCTRSIGANRPTTPATRQLGCGAGEAQHPAAWLGHGQRRSVGSQVAAAPPWDAKVCAPGLVVALCIAGLTPQQVVGRIDYAATVEGARPVLQRSRRDGERFN